MAGSAARATTSTSSCLARRRWRGESWIRRPGVPSDGGWRKPGSAACPGGSGVPYLSERQWGTVREDYSERRRRLERTSRTTRRARAPTAGARTAWPASPTIDSCSASRLRLWNGRDPILKERLFGLTNSEGNHGEDVKEYYFYLDSTPTHSYMKYLYKYPQAAVPLRRPGRDQPRSRTRRGRVRAAGHRCLRRRPLLRCLSSNTRRQRPDDLLDADHRAQPRA